MLIILEGVDGTGKSTLAQALSHRLEMPLYHSGAYRERPQMYAHTLSILFESRPNLICDRTALISEAIYGPRLRQSHAFERLNWEFMIDLLRSQRPIIIWCNRPLDKLVQQNVQLKLWKDELHAEKIKKHLPFLHADYVRMMKRLKERAFNIHLYDYEHNTLAEIVSLIEGVPQ